MVLTRATEAEVADVVELANLAYRDTGAVAGWTSEVGLIEGPRLSEARLREDLKRKPQAHLLLYRDSPAGPLLGTVWLEPAGGAARRETWYLGLLTIRPERQNRSLGRGLLAAAEAFAESHGARTMRMTVVNLRESLLAWYERRGYARTGKTQPFPYDDDRFGCPLREDLAFVVLEKKLRAAADVLDGTGDNA